MASSRSFRFVSLAMAVMFSAMSSGCYSNVAIRPDQIPRLSDMHSPTAIGQSGNTTIVAVPVATVLAPDGTNVEIKGEYDLVLGLWNGDVYTFEHPVRSALEGQDVLVINGANLPRTRFELTKISSAVVSQSNGSTAALIVLTVVTVGALGVIAAVGLSGSGD